MAKLSESKKLIGQWGEDQACEYLRRHGYRIVGRNYACRFGEIDVIASKRGFLAFVEVKLRAAMPLPRRASMSTSASRSASAQRGVAVACGE